MVVCWPLAIVHRVVIISPTKTVLKPHQTLRTSARTMKSRENDHPGLLIWEITIRTAQDYFLQGKLNILHSKWSLVQFSLFHFRQIFTKDELDHLTVDSSDHFFSLQGKFSWGDHFFVFFGYRSFQDSKKKQPSKMGGTQNIPRSSKGCVSWMIRGAEKHHPLGFKQHPNWKMLVPFLEHHYKLAPDWHMGIFSPLKIRVPKEKTKIAPIQKIQTTILRSIKMKIWDLTLSDRHKHENVITPYLPPTILSSLESFKSMLWKNQHFLHQPPIFFQGKKFTFIFLTAKKDRELTTNSRKPQKFT